VKATDAKFTFRSCKFYLTCPACGHSGEAEVVDQYLRTPHGTRLVLWNPEDIDIQYNEVTAETSYYYSLPGHVKTAIMVGKREIVTKSPQVYIDAVRQGKSIVLDSENVYHLRRPTILTGRLNRGWGVPLLLPVLKDTFYLQLMKKAQEAVLLERLLPLNIISPASATPGANPYELVNLSSWREHVMNEIMRWRRDPLYIPVMPLPVGHQTLGGDGRALLLNQEMRLVAESIIAGMGCPPELIFGGMSWSGSNVSLRMLENVFLRYLSGLLRFVKMFVIRRTAAHLKVPTVDVRFKKFKMADDVQRKAYMFQLNQSKLVSDTTLQQEADVNPEEEDALLRSEVKRRLRGIEEQQLAEAEIQGKMHVVSAKYQAEAQNVLAQEQQQMLEGTQGTAPGEPGAGELKRPVQPAETPTQGGGFGPILQRLKGMSSEAQQRFLERVSQQQPELANHIRSQLQGGQGAGVDMRPLPEQLPPRRSQSPI
jgi:hypothetical protein